MPISPLRAPVSEAEKAPLGYNPLRPSGDTFTPLEAAGDRFAPDQDALRGITSYFATSAAQEQAQRAQEYELAKDMANKEAMLRNASALQAQAEAGAQRVRSLRDIRGVGDAIDYAQGSVAAGAGSMLPVIAGAVATRFNPALGRGILSRAAPYAGAAVPAYLMERDEAIAGQYNDPTLAATPVEDRARAAQLKGLVNAGLESIVPGSIGASLLRKPAGSFLGHVGREMLTEGATEAAQQYTGHLADKSLDPNRQLDPWEMADAFAAGALTGGAVSGAGRAPSHALGAVGDALSRQAEAAAARTPPPEPGIDPNAPVDLGGPDAPGGGFGEGFTAGREAAMDLGRRVRGAAATKVDDFLDNLANPSPIDQLRDDLIPDDAHPDILDAADTGTALVVRDNAKAQRAQITAMKILADPDIPDLIKDQIRGLNGDYSSETARSLINSTALGKQVFDKTSDVLSDLAKDMSAFGRRTFKPNLQDVPLQDLNDLTQLVASKLGPKANEAPKLVQQMVALTARLSPDGSTEGIAKRLQSLSDAIGEDVIAELGKATGNKSIAADLKKLSLIPDIRNDVAKSEGKSFFESMLATPLNNADKRTAIQATQSALREYERAGEDRRRFIENKLGEHLFGNAERAKTVIQYYHNMEQQSRAKDELRFAPGEDEGPSTLTEQDAVVNDAKYRDGNIARPFFGKFDTARLRKALRTARAAYGTQNVRSATYADFVGAHPDRNAGVEAARIRSDLSKRLVDNENRDTATVQQAISVLESIPESERSDDHGELLAALKGRKTEDRSKQLTRLRKEMSAIKNATGVDVGELNRLRNWVRSETTKKMERKYGAADRGEANSNILDNIDTMDRVELSRFIERHTKKLEGIEEQDSDLAGWISSEIDYAKERQSGIESGKVVENKEDSPEVASAKAKIASMEKALSDNAPKMLGLYRTIIHPRDDTYASDEKLSRFRKLLDEGRNINVQDKPENKQRRADIAATRVTFKTKDGKDLNLSLESMVHNSGVFGSIEERLFSAIASVMAHPDMDKNSFQTPRDDAIVMRGKHGADHVYWGDLVHKDLEQALSDQKERIEGRKDWTEAQREAFAKRREKGEKQRASDRQKRAKQDIRTRGDLQQIVQELNVDALTERLKGQLGKNGLTLEKIEAATKADNPVEALISLFPAARRQAARRQAARNALDYMLGEAQRISDIKPKYRSAEDHSALRVLNAEIKSELGDLYPMDLGTKRRLADTREESGGRDGHKNVGAELLHHEAMIESLMDRLHEVAGVPSLEAYYNAWISGLEKTYEAIRSGASGESRTPMVENRENLYAEIAGRREKTAGPTPADLRTKAKILRAAAKGDKLAPLAKPKRSEAQIERELGDLEASFAPGGTMASLTAAEKADMRAAFGPERSVETGKLRPAEELLEEAEALEAQADAIQRKSEGPPKTGPRSTLARQKAALNKLVKRGLAAERDGTYYLREAESSKHAVLKLSDGTVIINMGRINAAPEKVLRKFLDDKKLLLGEARLSPERLLDVLGKNPRRVASFMRDVLKKDTIADALSPQERDAAWAGKGLRPPPKAAKREEFPKTRKQSFVGAKADPEGAAQASSKLDAGWSADFVWASLGWFRGPDGKMRKEIRSPLINKRIRDFVRMPEAQGMAAESLFIRDLLKGVPGFEAYLDSPLGDVSISNNEMIGGRGFAGQFYPEENYIWFSHEGALAAALIGRAGPEMVAEVAKDAGMFATLDDYVDQLTQKLKISPAEQKQMAEDALVSTILHEIQHAIQKQEGFENGGTPEAAVLVKYGLLDKYNAAEFFLDKADVIDEAMQMLLADIGPDADPRAAAQALYKDIIGEVEAHDVEKRMKLTDAEAKGLPPALTDAKREFLRSAINMISASKLRMAGKQTTIGDKRKPPNAAEHAALKKKILEEIRRTRGNDVKLRFNRLIKHIGASGEFSMNADKTDRLIEIAVNAADPMGVAWHESLHDFFAMLGEDRSSRSIKRDLTNAANAPHVKRQLEKLLAKHPEALKQIENDPEERVAYMYQFWAAGELSIGPTGTNIFQKLRQFFFDMFKIATGDQRAEDILTAFHEGEFADSRVVAEVLADLPRDTVRNRIERFSPALSDFLHATAQIAPDRLRDFQNEEISGLADKLEKLVQRRFQQQGVWENKLAGILAGTTAVERRTALENMQARKDPTSPLEKKLAGFYKEMYDYMSKKGVETYLSKEKKWVPLREVGDYFPRSWDRNTIEKDRAGFEALLVQHGGMTPAAARASTTAIIESDGRLELAENEHSLGFTPFAKAAIDRRFTFIKKNNAAEFAKYQIKDLMDISSAYIRQATHRAEYAGMFGNDGKEIADAIARSKITDKKDLEAIDNSVRAMEGTLNQDKLSLGTKNFMSGLQTMQNLTLLPLAIFSQSIDPIVMAARTGDLKDAGNAYVTAVKRLMGKKVPGEELAEMLGIISQDSVMEAMGYAYGSTYMNRPLTKINRAFFKYNGMQGWNNSMRIAATVAGEKYLLANRSNAKALEELGLEPSDIQVLQAYNNGVRGEGLDYSNPKIREAMYQFVDQAVLRPSAANRPVWMSDPRFQLVAHLKQFTFAMHNVVLKRATQQADEGNHVPWAILGLTVPVILAADMAKFALTGTVPANWGFMDYLVHSVERSGILGLGDFSVQATRGMDAGAAPGEGLLGPTLENLFKILRWAGGDPRVKFEDVLDRTVPGAKFV